MRDSIIPASLCSSLARAVALVWVELGMQPVRPTCKLTPPHARSGSRGSSACWELTGLSSATPSHLSPAEEL